jgi:lysophospholipid acyltransferase (LPLAT)-like uncharacterized protein
MVTDSPTTATTAPPRPSRRPAVLGFLVWLIARAIGVTLRIRFEHRERLEDAAATGEGVIFVLWHGRTLIPANVWRKRGYWVLISLSRDGEMQKNIFQRFGFQIVRGSTGRGGVKAALQLARKVREGGALALTPDGPRGPTHKVQQGTIFIAQRAGCPIVPVGVSARPRKLFGSWDSYMLPMPFARASVVIGETIRVPQDLDEEGQQRVAEQIECALNAVEARAEELMGYPSHD